VDGVTGTLGFVASERHIWTLGWIVAALIGYICSSRWAALVDIYSVARESVYQCILDTLVDSVNDSDNHVD
jgi:hypothetical protein